MAKKKAVKKAKSVKALGGRVEIVGLPKGLAKAVAKRLGSL